MERWLTNNKYLCGPDKSIADLSACHELDQTKFLPFDLSVWPKTEQWLFNMIDEDPISLSVAVKMRKLASSNIEKRSKI